MDLDGNAANGRQDGMGMKQLCHEVRPLDPKKFAKTMDLYYIYIYLCSGGCCCCCCCCCWCCCCCCFCCCCCCCCCCCFLMGKINPCIPVCQDMFFRVAVASYSIGIIPAMEHGTKTGKNIIRDALLYILWVKCHKPSPSHHHFYRCYGYHSQSWVVYYCFNHIIIWLII